MIIANERDKRWVIISNVKHKKNGHITKSQENKKLHLKTEKKRGVTVHLFL
jgi:hypothetical protein